MSNKLFQSVIGQFKDSIDYCVGVMDESAVVIACSDISKIGQVQENLLHEINQNHDIFVYNGYTYKQIGTRAKLEYIVFVEGIGAVSSNLCSAISVMISSIKGFYDERHDKTNLVKNIIMDNILPGDVVAKSKELHLANDVNRVVLLVHTKDLSDYLVQDLIQNTFAEKNKDFVISVNENDIAFIKEIRTNIDAKELEKTAKSIVDALQNEFSISVNIGIGTIVGNVKDIARSYKEAQIAIEVEKVFDTEKPVINYENLGIGRLIYQLPTTLCEMFLQEVFKKGSIESLDNETLFTIHKFFENNLNVSETSRKLFVHRNTLVYRLEKIRKITGLDLREFDHAIIFKVALMVKKYLASSNTSKF